MRYSPLFKGGFITIRFTLTIHSMQFPTETQGADLTVSSISVRFKFLTGDTVMLFAVLKVDITVRFVETIRDMRLRT